MFASRFFRPLFRTATRSFTARSTPRAPLIRPIWRRTQTLHTFRRPVVGWQSTFRRAQTRHYVRPPFSYQRVFATRHFLYNWAQRPTFFYEIGGIGVLCGGYYIYNLETVPVSGRKRFNVVSTEFEESMAKSAYQEVMQEYGNKIMPENAREVRMVHRVLARLLPHSGLEHENWEVYVIDDPTKNAFVVPGGKVFVFRGILDVCKGEDGLAAVLGHEIAHNVAHHAAEKMSRMVVILPVGIIAWLVTGVDPGLVRFGVNLMLSLPNSRKQEEEADYIGLLMMAESCYDPSAAIGLWTRMEQAEQYSPPQFLSTHPSSHNRIGKMKEWLPQAEVKREDSDCHALGSLPQEFRRVADFSRW